MDFETLINNLTPEIYANLKRAVEIGKWPDGRAVTAEQRAHCMQAVIAWEARHLPEEQRIGYIDRGHKEEGEMCGDHDHDHAQEQPIKWTH